MQIRILAGCKRLMMALAIASLIVAPAVAATPSSKGKPASGTPMASGKLGQQVDDASKSAEPILYLRSNYVWPFSTGPVYGTVELSRSRDSGVLHTQVGSFDLTRGMPNLPSELRSTNRLAALGSQYFVLQVNPDAFTSGAFDEMKRSIVAQGGAIVGEIPVAAFVVRMTPGAYTAISASDAIIALEPFQPAFKLSPQIGRVPLMDPVKANASVYSLELRLFPGESVEAVAGSLKAMGLKVTKSYGDMVFVDADRSKLAAIASLEPVFMINEALPLVQMSEETTTTVQTGRWNNGATPYNDAGVDGGGLDKASQSDDQLLMIVDTGIQFDAGDLSNSRVDSGFDVGTGLPIAGHRKVAFYGTTNAFGGVGDLLGCDGNTTSGVTHGHTVAVIALGNATKVPVAYGAGWRGIDADGNSWSLDGVAPKARLIAYDAQITPPIGRCDDPTQGNLLPGDLYNTGLSGTSALADGYAKGARVINFSWGKVANDYDANALDIDQFLFDKSDALVFVAAGNDGRDKNVDRIPDPGTIGAPATAKNALVVGASRNADDLGDPDLPNSRWFRSSNGPATPGSGRIAPLLMAPGTDAGSLGLASEFSCRTNDNDQTNPVECDVITGQISTSYATAAAAGAGLLVRDYFAQGFYPDGTNTNPGNNSDKVATISGALLKAILVTSAEWMHQPGNVIAQVPTNEPWGATAPDFYGNFGALSRRFRGNREQGFGRIRLTNSLPLVSYPSAVSGLIVDDGGGAPAGLVHSTTLNTKINAGADSRTCSLDRATSCASDVDCPGLGTCSPYILNVCDTTQPLTIAIAWMDEGVGDSIVRDLNLEVTSPSGRVYLGNFFTDDTNDDAAITGSEDCTYTGQPWPPNFVSDPVDTGPWSLPSACNGGTCTGVSCVSAASHVDTVNNVEAIFLSPDSRLNGIADDPTTTSTNEATDNQIEQGGWSVVVKAPSANLVAQNYAIAITGGVCLGSAVRIQKVLPLGQISGGPLACNDSVVVTIDEVDTPSDPIGGLTTTEIASRTRIDVLDANGVITDTECGVGNTLCVNGAGAPIPQKLLVADFTIVSSVGGNIRFTLKKQLLTEGTAPDSGNGALDVRDGQTVRVTYQDENGGIPDPNARRTASAPVVCRPLVTSGGVVFSQLGKDIFTLVNGGCERDARGYFTFGFPDRYMDAGELLSYSIVFQSSETSATLVNVEVSLRAVTADPDSPASCKPGTTACADPNRTNNPVSPYLHVLDSPKTFGAILPGRAITPTFTIQMEPVIPGTQKVDMIIGVTSKTTGKSAETIIVQRETLNADENQVFYSTDFPQGGAGAVLNYDLNNNEVLEAVTLDPHDARNDYIFETQSYSDMTANPLNDFAHIHAPWNFDTDNGGFVSGLNNSSRPGIGTVAQWGEDTNFNGALDGFCSIATSLLCTQGDAASESCRRCSLNSARACLNNAGCQSPNEGTCSAPGALGTCNFTLGEDRDPANGALDASWSTLGGCGWQTKATPASLTGGVWHSGQIRDLSTSACLAAGPDPGRCQSYERLPNGDLAGDNNWWEMLLTPVLNKVNQGVVDGDPEFQVEITDWAWNMLIDIPDSNTSVRLEFDTDINKVTGAELFNDIAVTGGFGGETFGAVAGGNNNFIGGASMFGRISHCVDTDGNGTPDHCGTALGKLCGADPADTAATIDDACTGNDISTTRGYCATPPAQKKCTATLINCSTSATCLAGESCVFDYKICSQDSDCSVADGSICNHTAGNNRHGKDSCFFEGKKASGIAVAQQPYGLATPDDDDVANGFCNRSDSLTGTDKSVMCISNTECTVRGAPYTTCNLTNHPGTAIDAFVRDNGPGRNYPFKSVANEPDLRTSTLEDLYGDTGNQFRASIGFDTVEAIPNTVGGTIGFGVAIDDMVIAWKETSLVEDTHDCAGSGECADLETSTGVSFEGNSVVNLTVIDRTPYDSVNPKNDCNGDGDYTDAAKHCWNQAVPGSGSNVACTTVGASCSGIGGAIAGEYCFAADSNDCNNNLIPDVTVKLTSTPGEPLGEIAILDQTLLDPAVYKAAFPYSTFYDSPGTLFVVQSGTSAPTIIAKYEDRDTIPGAVDERCKNDLEPSKQGILLAQVTVNVVTGKINVQSFTVNNVSICSLTVGGLNKQCTTNADCGTFCSISHASCETLANCPVGQTCVSSGFGLCNSCTGAVGKTCTPGLLATNPAGCTAAQGTCTSTASYGDPDGFADTNETINLAVRFKNKAGIDVDDLTATLGTTSPNIECITRSSIIVGALAADAVSDPTLYPAFQFKVSPTVNRTSVTQTIQAKFTLTIRSNKFDALTRAVDITLDLDLNATGNVTESAFLEDFTGSGFGKFTLDTISANKATLALSDGYRCQYNDPFGLNSNDPGRADCFLGFTADTTNVVNDWHIHTSAASSAQSGGIGRAFRGTQSLHMGVHQNPASPDRDTTRLKQLVGVKTVNGINMPLSGANPELSYAQQVSFTDCTSLNTTCGEVADRGVVAVQIVATTGLPSGSWVKIYPYENVYDQQGTDDYFDCLFDPTDDGNNEDSFFDPTDPLRAYGPSSTCFPEFVFAKSGQTDYRKAFNVTDIGKASDGPGLPGCSGAGCLPPNTVPGHPVNPGTWIQPKFSLNQYAGRVIRLRFLFSSIEITTTTFMGAIFQSPVDNPDDDGWYIDDIHIDHALANPLTLTADQVSPAINVIPCGNCTDVNALLTATPTSLSVPGQLVTLDGRTSVIDKCKNGVPQFQFWRDDNLNGVVDDPGDFKLRDWTDNPTFLDAPLVPTQYIVKVRCSTDTGCDSASNSSVPVLVGVQCPASSAFLGSIRVDKPGAGAPGAEPEYNATISWGGALTVKLVRGDLLLLRSSGGVTNVDTLPTPGCLANNTLASSVIDNSIPTSGAAYYLMQTPQFCNVSLSGSFRENLPSEKPGAGSNRDVDIAADPDHCP